MMDHEDGDLMITLAGSVTVLLEGVVPGVDLMVRAGPVFQVSTRDNMTPHISEPLVRSN